MSMLTDLFNITEYNGSSGIILTTPVKHTFTFDLNDIIVENNVNSSVIWNFGDPDSVDNEIVSSSVANAFVTHTYTYAGLYTIHSIANVNGVTYHIEQIIIINDIN